MLVFVVCVVCVVHVLCGVYVVSVVCAVCLLRVIPVTHAWCDVKLALCLFCVFVEFELCGAVCVVSVLCVCGVCCL